MKKLLLQIPLLGGALFFVARSTLFWEYGIYSYENKNMEVEKESKKIESLKRKIDFIKNEISSWKNGGLRLEHAAREELLMSLDDEVVFYLFSKNSVSKEEKTLLEVEFPSSAVSVRCEDL